MRSNRRRVLSDSSSRHAPTALFLPSSQRGEGDKAFTPPRRQACHRGSQRAGFTLLEMFVAAIVFGAALVTFLPMMQSVGFQQRLTEQRLLALREADSQLEVITGHAWNALTTEGLTALSLSDEAKSRLPQAALKVEMNQPAEPPSSKRVVVQVSWTPRAGQAAQSVRLAAWFFRTEEQP